MEKACLSGSTSMLPPTSLSFADPAVAGWLLSSDSLPSDPHFSQELKEQCHKLILRIFESFQGSSGGKIIVKFNLRMEWMLLGPDISHYNKLFFRFQLFKAGFSDRKNAIEL